MDNLTHTLISALVGETAARATTSREQDLPQPIRRGVLVTTMAVGGNLPDLDFLYTSLIGGKLEYLLHHRGHTHTILGALAAAALLWLAVQGWLHWKRLSASRRDAALFTGAALLAPLLHLAMDWTNNYGVHPFWPWNDAWFYGDSVFIIEPLLWAASAPLVFLLRTRMARAAVALVLFAALGLSVFSGLVPAVASFCLAMLMVALLLSAWRFRPVLATALGVMSWLFVTFVFVASSRHLEQRAQLLAAARYPSDYLAEAVLTPSPANPFCWDVILVQSAGDQIALRRVMMALAPGLFEAARCPTRSLGVPISAPVTPVAASDDAGAKWYGEVLFSRAELAAAVASDCRAAAFMLFARAPWLSSRAGATVLGDLRYDREPALSFAEIDLAESISGCPTPLPPWRPPRADLLGRPPLFE